jgi:serine kinase of HPr protein (carbohydrate metabolism regulator)
MRESPPTIHASAVQVGDAAILIRGPSGSGKSRLALDLILAGRTGQIPPTVLVGDDRVHLEVRNAHVYVRAARELAGLIEIRGLGVRRIDFVEESRIGLVVDLAAADAERLPAPHRLAVPILGVATPRIPVLKDVAAFPLVAGYLITTDSPDAGRSLERNW